MRTVLRSTQPLIALIWNSTLPLITGISLNNKSIYYLLAICYVPGIGISTDVFHLILIKALLSDYIHFINGETKMYSNPSLGSSHINDRCPVRLQVESCFESLCRLSPHCPQAFSSWPSGLPESLHQPCGANINHDNPIVTIFINHTREHLSLFQGIWKAGLASSLILTTRSWSVTSFSLILRAITSLSSPNCSVSSSWQLNRGPQYCFFPFIPRHLSLLYIIRVLKR